MQFPNWGPSLILGFCCIISSAAAQEASTSHERWDISPWGAIATGEENTDSFNEARISTAGVFLGRVMGHEFLGVGAAVWQSSESI